MDALERMTHLLKVLDGQRPGLERLHRYYRGESAVPVIPAQASAELKLLALMARTAWGGLIVDSMAERLIVDGIKATDPRFDEMAWGWWQASGLDARQIAVHTDAQICAETYVLVWPGAPSPAIRGLDRRRTVGTPAGTSAYDLVEAVTRWASSDGLEVAVLYDAEAAHIFARATDRQVGALPRSWRAEPDVVDVGSPDWVLVDVDEHGLGVCPVVRMPNVPDLTGEGTSDLATHLPVIDRITETVMGRTTAGKFGAYRQRWASGIDLGAKIDPQTGEPVLGPDGKPLPAGSPFRYGSDLVWTTEDPDAKFGSFEATDLRPIIEAVDQDIKHLAAVSRTPAHYLLTGSANPPSAEALLAAESGLVSKVARRQLEFGEAWEQVIRLAALAAGETALAEDAALQMVWRRTEVRSIGAVADALLKLRQMNLPLSILLEMLGMSPQTIARITAEAEAERRAQAAAQAVALGS